MLKATLVEFLAGRRAGAEWCVVWLLWEGCPGPEEEAEKPISVVPAHAWDGLRMASRLLCSHRLNWSSLAPSWLRHRQLGLQAKDQNFMLEDSAFWIFGGSVHYFRVPRAYWRDRLLKMKACGLNTLTT